MDPDADRAPFVTFSALVVQFFLRENGNLPQTLWRPAPNATVPCTLHSASDGLPLADRLWMETLGGPNEKPVRSSVTD